MLPPIVLLIAVALTTTVTFAHADPGMAGGGSKTRLAARAETGEMPHPAFSLESLSGVEATFYNVNTRETESFFLRFDGVMSSEDEKRIRHLFRCKRTGHELQPDRGLVQILARVADRFEGHVLELVSAHRRNRGTSRTSKHWSGHAVDLRVRDVPVKKVRAFLWKMDAPIGLGYYREQQFVHIDYRPLDGKIAWDQRREGSGYRYHPAWSGGPPKKQKQKAKRPSRERRLRSAQPNT